MGMSSRGNTTGTDMKMMVVRGGRGIDKRREGISDQEADLQTRGTGIEGITHERAKCSLRSHNTASHSCM